MKICVVALGKIGLPLAVQFAAKGHPVIVGADISRTCRRPSTTVRAVPRRDRPGRTKLKQAVTAGLLTATTDTTTAVADADAVVIVVPLFVDAEGVPDFGWMDSATRAVAAGLRPGTLVSYETTLPVGTTRTPLGADARRGLRPDRRRGLLPGLQPGAGAHRAGLRRPAPLPEAGRRHRRGVRRAAGVEFYQAVLDFDERPDLDRPNGVWDLGSAEASELAKLAETTYRDVNIGLANQFARFADTRRRSTSMEVIEACNTQPYSHIHQPGIAVGGHCIPIYPRMYLWNDPSATVVAVGTRSQRGDAGVRGGPARGRGRRPDRRAGAGAGGRVPGRGEGDRVLRGVRDGRRSCARAGRRRTCRTRCTPPRS